MYNIKTIIILYKRGYAMPKKIIFSLDYDGCADILFDERFAGSDMESFGQELFVERQRLEKYLEEKARESDVCDVEVYIGSNRQDQLIDMILASKNKNGNCLRNIPTFCAQNTKRLAGGKVWKFNPLLLADVVNKKPAGSAAQDLRLQSYIHGHYNKTPIIKAQLENIAKNHSHPDDEVHLYFVDDQEYVLSDLELSCRQGVTTIPSNIHVHLVRFDWSAELDNSEPILRETAYIQGEKIVKYVVADKKSSVVRPVSPILPSLVSCGFDHKDDYDAKISVEIYSYKFGDAEFATPEKKMQDKLMDKLIELQAANDQPEKLKALFSVYLQFKNIDFSNNESIKNVKNAIRENLSALKTFSSSFGRALATLRHGLFGIMNYSLIQCNTIKLVTELSDFVEANAFPEERIRQAIR